MLKQTQQQRLQHKLSPQQIQIVKLLELPILQFEERIEKELEENLLLEKKEDLHTEADTEDVKEDNKYDDEFSLEDYINDDDTPHYRLHSQNYSKDKKYEEIPFSKETTLHDHLIAQLGLRRNLTEDDRQLGMFIIGNIDTDGYLRRDLEAITDDLVFSANIYTEKETLEKLLNIVQDFDPSGVGARSLQECLALQLKKKKGTEEEDELAIITINQYFKIFAKKNYELLMKNLKISREKMKVVIDKITSLNPKPGSVFHDSSTKGSSYIIPDFIIEMKEGEITLSLNSINTPELVISDNYKSLLNNKLKTKNKKQKDVNSFIQKKTNSAKWFIDAVRQRQETLISVMSAIIKRQQKFFEEGDEYLLKPMILKDIADDTGLDISTISRVSNSKYVQAHFGVLPLKYFFSEGMKKESGEEVSSREIKMIIQEYIDKENKQNPLTDELLTEVLQKKSYIIARRTVAKYRENLGIPVARLRKEL